MELDRIQRTMFDAVRQPLTADEGMRQRTRDGKSLRVIANEIIKPNDRLTSFERLEIYNRQYWFRILAALSEDFPGLRAVIGERRFEKLAIAYLLDCPSRSFTMRNLGSRLEAWLRAHSQHIAKFEEIALDMVRLEWAEIEAFDEAGKPKLTEAELPGLGPDPKFELQPYVRLLDLTYPVDDLLIRVRREGEAAEFVSNAVTERVRSRARRPRLPKPERIFLSVHRANNSVYFKRIDQEAYTILCALRDGKRLSDAIDTVDWSDRPPEDAPAAVQQWFAYWSAQGWFCKTGNKLGEER
ncbi:MAG: DNA-binding domain-containing protein [Candidatus Korobacteraceae bacterium]